MVPWSCWNGTDGQVTSCSVAQSCPALCDPREGSTPGLCPSPSPEVHQSSCSLHQSCHPAISSSDALFSSSPQWTFPMSQLFKSAYWRVSSSPSNKFLRLVTLKTDGLDLSAVQGSLRRLLQRLSYKGINSLDKSVLVYKHWICFTELNQEREIYPGSWLFSLKIIAIYHIFMSIYTCSIFPESNTANLNPIRRTEWRARRETVSSDTLGLDETKRTTGVDFRRKSISSIISFSFFSMHHFFLKILFKNHGPFLSSLLNLWQYGFSLMLWLFWPARHVRQAS